MSDDPNRDSIPLLLQRPSTTTRPPPTGKPRLSMRVPSARVETTGKMGSFRSWLGAVGILLGVLLMLCAVVTTACLVTSDVAYGLLDPRVREQQVMRRRST